MLWNIPHAVGWFRFEYRNNKSPGSYKSCNGIFTQHGTFRELMKKTEYTLPSLRSYSCTGWKRSHNTHTFTFPLTLLYVESSDCIWRSQSLDMDYSCKCIGTRLENCNLHLNTHILSRPTTSKYNVHTAPCLVCCTMFLIVDLKTLFNTKFASMYGLSP
jgi:hypothetical protein